MILTSQLANELIVLIEKLYKIDETRITKEMIDCANFLITESARLDKEREI